MRKDDALALRSEIHEITKRDVQLGNVLTLLADHLLAAHGLAPEEVPPVPTLEGVTTAPVEDSEQQEQKKPHTASQRQQTERKGHHGN